MKTTSKDQITIALPTITIEGVNFFVDFRLEEIRPINAPFLAIYFDDLNEKYKAEISKLT